MDNGSQGAMQTRNLQNRTQVPTRNTASLYPSLNSRQTGSNIWSPSLGDLSSSNNNNNSNGATGLKTNGIGAIDSSLWSRPGAATWNSSDSQPFKQNASRSTSPPAAQQDTSNASPPFVPARSASFQTAAFSGSNNYMPAYSTQTANYSTYPETTQADVVNNLANFAGFQRSVQTGGHFDDSRDSMLPPSRHSENEASLQYGNETSAFANTFGSHSRQQSRMSLSGLSSYNMPQQAGSRSQSHSYNSQSEQAQAIRDYMQATVSGPRASATQGSSPAPTPFGLREIPTYSGFNITANNYPDTRRDSVASMHHNSTLNSPRTYGSTRQETWPSPTTFDQETLNRIQRSQQNTISRQAGQIPYMDSAYTMFDQAQLLQQMQQQQGALTMPFQSYGYQTGQQLFPPSGPAGMVPRSGRIGDLATGVRCQELEEFRRSSKSNRKWELKNVFGRVVEFAGDQQGSRFLQEKIPTANSDDRQRVFDEIMVDANALMVDVFGNYVVQQLFEHGTMVQKRLLAGKMVGHVVQLSTQLYGCRCVQEALEYILVEQQVELAKEIEPDIIRIMKSDNGNHVVQKILTKLPRDRIDFVYDAVRGRIPELSQQQYACRVIQRMIEKGTEADKAFILEEFHEVAHKLVTDNWGNYVVQAVIRQGGQEARGRVIRLCLDQFAVFSKQKVASNVMEHCIEYGTEEDRLEMFRLITRQAEDGSSLLQAMWKDNFANYVVQKLCHCLVGQEQATLVKESKPYFEARKKPSRPDDKWVAFEKLINQFSAPPSRQGSVSSHNAAGGSRPASQADINSAMPTPGLTTGDNSPRTNSSHDTNDAGLDQPERYLTEQLSKATLHEIVNGHAA